jgi:hypothetical protein
MEEHRLRVSTKRVLRKILGPEKNDVTGSCSWRKLLNEQFHNLFPLFTKYYQEDEMEHGCVV